MLIVNVESAALRGIQNFNWQWRRGERWAVVGDTGSGKTTLVETLLGRQRLARGTITWHGNPVFMPCKETPRGAAYYQQRFEYADADEPQTLQEYLGTDDEALLERFRLTSHRDQPFMNLSNGQMRKARIAKALMQGAEVLVLDDPFLGLDGDSRRELGELLSDRMLITCRAADLPSGIDNIIVVNSTSIEIRRGPSVSEELTAPPLTLGPRETSNEPVIELRNVTVRHAGRTILDDVSWTVRRGERWALTGPNGAGKTTLLSLVVGDHPQAFSNDVRLFGARRGGGETLWDLRRRVGFVSPEFHLFFAEDLSASEAAETGFTDTLLHRRPSAEQAAVVRRIFADLGLEALMPRPMRQLSTGQQRLALLVRALVKRPPLVVLDEPYQGLDAALIARLNRWLTVNLTDEQTLIVTTHRLEELPPMVDRRLQLVAGQTCV